MKINDIKAMKPMHASDWEGKYIMVYNKLTKIESAKFARNYIFLIINEDLLFTQTELEQIQVFKEIVGV